MPGATLALTRTWSSPSRNPGSLIAWPPSWPNPPCALMGSRSRFLGVRAAASFIRPVAARNRAENKSGDHQAVIDTSIINGLRELQEPGEPDAAVELIDLFLRDTPVKIQSLQSAIARSDALSLKETAHGLKGSASNLGARRLSRLCADLEKLAAAGKLAEAAELFGQVTDEYSRVCFVLEQEKKKQINSA